MQNAQVRSFKHNVRIFFQWLKTVRVCACTNSHSFQLLEENLSLSSNIINSIFLSPRRFFVPRMMSGFFFNGWKQCAFAHAQIHLVSVIQGFKTSVSWLKVDVIRASSAVQTRCQDYFSMVENSARLRTV